MAPCIHRPSMLAELAPGRLADVTLQQGADDGAGGTTDHQLLSRLHLVAQVGQTTLWVDFKLFLGKKEKEKKNIINYTKFNKD